MKLSVVVGVAGVLASGCRTPTQVTVDVSTDAPCASVKGTSVTVGALGAIETRPPSGSTDACAPGAPLARIGALVVVPSGGSGDPFAIKVVAGIDRPTDACAAPDYEGCIVARRSLRFIPHAELQLPVPLRASCKGVPCTPETTCVDGTCVPAEIPDPEKCAVVGVCGEGVLLPGGAGGAGGGAASSTAASSGGGGASASSAAAGGGGATSSSSSSSSSSAASSSSSSASSSSASSGAGGGGACPVDMAEVPATVGGSYCIDATEVTRDAYAAFVLAKNGDVTGQPAYCAWNASYVADATCMATPVGVCQGALCGAHPQVCVDWCDAYAYCAWAGKRLCGAVGGGPLPFGSNVDAAASQWFNACSAGGAKQWPYGAAYDSGICNSKSYPNNGTTIAVASAPGCVGGYPGIHDLSGNVYEHQDACSATAGASDGCRAMGGAFIGNSGVSMSCVATASSTQRSDAEYWIGFRCCGP